MQNQELVRQILALLTTDDSSRSKQAPKGCVQRPVLVRCTGAGVHAGLLDSIDGQTVRLTNARRLWRWRVPIGAPSFLSGVATHGVDAAHSKVGTPVTVSLTEACEVIDMTPDAWASVVAAPEVERTN